MTDREKVIKHFEHLLNAAKGNYQDFVDLTVECGEEILALLKEQEAVVRCKDCRYCTIAADKKWRQDFGKSIYECDHKGFCCVEPDWFCADGERRTNNG